MGAPQYPPAVPYTPYPQYPVPQPSNEKPTAAFVLSLLGGVFYLLNGTFWFVVESLLSPFAFGYVGSGYLALYGALSLVFGTLLVLFAVLLYVQPHNHLMFGILVLVFSIVGVAFGGGFFLGLILGLIGGILGIVWKPTPVVMQPVYLAPPAPQQPAGRVCMKCGRMVGLELKFCPHCGNALG